MLAKSLSLAFNSRADSKVNIMVKISCAPEQFLLIIRIDFTSQGSLASIEQFIMMSLINSNCTVDFFRFCFGILLFLKGCKKHQCFDAHGVGCWKMLC